jgi:tagaturonate reductase
MIEITAFIARKPRPIRVLQYGEGNFLRAFVDYMIDIANEKGLFDGDVAVVKPIVYGSLEAFGRQDNLYTVCLRGKAGGQVIRGNRIVGSIGRVVDAYEGYESYMALAKEESLEFIVSNTTEAGIVFDPSDEFDACPPRTYPGKLTQFLFRRFEYFHGAKEKGLILLPVELIENNGGKLLECVLRLMDAWHLPEAFKTWVEESCVFCSTLVDRIVTGYPKDSAKDYWLELGYEDRLLTICEPFALWVIESPRDISGRLPLDEAGLPVVFTKDQRPFRERKVRLLNGAHTSTVLHAYLMGMDIVGECMADPDIRRFMEEAVFSEIAPTVPLPQEEVKAFADSVFERFENPFIRHALLSIALNSVSKWKSRILPSLLDSLEQTGKLPRSLTFSFAALLAFYTIRKQEDVSYVGLRPGGGTYPVQDDRQVLEFFASSSGKPTEEYVQLAASNISFWGRDLSLVPGFVPEVARYLNNIRTIGPRAAMNRIFEE